MNEKKKAPIILGIVSIVLAMFPIVGLICGIVAIVLSNSSKKQTGHDYKTEIILGSIGIALSVIIWIVTVMYLVNSAPAFG